MGMQRMPFLLVRWFGAEPEYKFGFKRVRLLDQWLRSGSSTAEPQPNPAETPGWLSDF
jgi:hypothetical protein